MGSLFKRGDTWWIQYYQHSKRHRESSKSHLKMVAKELLKLREGQIAEGKVPGLLFDRVKFADLVTFIRTDYQINGRKSTERLEASIKQLSSYFTGYRVPEITVEKVEKYVIQRLQIAKPGTINRELSALKRMFSLAVKFGKAPAVPKIGLLTERNTRKGFFEHGDFLTFRDALPPYLKGFTTFAYRTGWRTSEITGLAWSQVDRKEWIVRLEPGEGKTDEARNVYLDDELQDIFTNLWKTRKKSKRVNPFVFPNKSGTGKISDFRGAWSSAQKKTGIVRHFHDLRRTAVRNMVRAGIPERVAMQISGHKTRSIFDRYNIVSDNDLKLAAQRLSDYQNTADSHKIATINHINKKTGQAN